MLETAPAAVSRHLLGDARWQVLSITTDRGSEFATLSAVAELGRPCVCDAQRPNQRGTNKGSSSIPL